MFIIKLCATFFIIFASSVFALRLSPNESYKVTLYERVCASVALLSLGGVIVSLLVFVWIV